MTKTRLLSMCASLLAGCNLPGAGGTCEDNPGANHFALNPATGECWEFASSCDVPDDWPPCAGGCRDDDDCAAGQACVENVCVAIACASDAECPAGSLCVDGACVEVGPTCVSDDDCPLTQHCDWSHTPPGDPGAPASGVCVDNGTCAWDGDCVSGQWCDFGGGGDCDPTAPGCGGVAKGQCTRGPRPGACYLTSDCQSGQICPAEYGWCGPVPTPGPNPPTPPGGGAEDALVCESVCQTACWSDAGCPDGTMCNNNTICGTPNPINPPVPPACAGWCVPRT